MGRLQTLQHGRGWGAAGAPLQTPKSPGAPGSPLPELLWEVKHTEPKACRACSLRAGRGAPGYDSFSLPTWPTLTSSLIRLLTAPGAPPSPQPHGQGAVQFFPSLCQDSSPTPGCPGASTSPLCAASPKWEQKEAERLCEEAEAADPGATCSEASGCTQGSAQRSAVW